MRGGTPTTGAGQPSLVMAEEAGGVQRTREQPVAGPVPLYVHPAWAERFDWLVQGTTGRGSSAEAFDLTLFGAAPTGSVHGRWRALREAAGCPRAVHARQVHGSALLHHDEARPGLFVAEGFDGHWTATPGVLLTVSVADCVPVFAVDPTERRIALLHAGWRGVASGVLEAGLSALAAQGSPAAALYLHLGPAICGDCYEVGPEVHRALGAVAPVRPTPVDLRAVLVRRAIRQGVPAARITVSEHCTRCGQGFFSHRGGDTERQMGVLGIRPAGQR